MQFKTLVIRMLRDLMEYGKHIREEMKATLSEIKKNPQGTSSEGKEARVQINKLNHKEELNSQPDQKEETVQKRRGENKKILRHLQKCQHPNHSDVRRRRGRARN